MSKKHVKPVYYSNLYSNSICKSTSFSFQILSDQVKNLAMHLKEYICRLEIRSTLGLAQNSKNVKNPYWPRVENTCKAKNWRIRDDKDPFPHLKRSIKCSSIHFWSLHEALASGVDIMQSCRERQGSEDVQNAAISKEGFWNAAHRSDLKDRELLGKMCTSSVQNDVKKMVG